MATSVREQRPAPAPGPPTTPRPAPPAGPDWRRLRRVLTLAALISLIPAGVSFVQAVAKPSNSTFGIRAVEWLKDNGARGFVNTIESIYYSLTAPSKGGPTLTALPTQPNASAGPATPVLPQHIVVHHFYRPRRIQPVIHPALPGEGVWRPTFHGGGSQPPVLVTSFRSDPSYPRVVAGVAWFDHTRTTTSLYPGRLEPDVPMPSRGPMEVPPSRRSRLVATFNGGFKYKDFGGGFAVGGHTYAPMKPGLATTIRYTSGKVDVKMWRGGPDVDRTVVWARQNLPLIVNEGRPSPNLSDGPEWGFTLGNAVRVWRSAVGIDRHHNLIYAAAPDQTVGSLADILVRAGALRAMELDINSYWTTLITYSHGGAGGPADLLSAMSRPPTRYLTSDDRDFFAVYMK